MTWTLSRPRCSSIGGRKTGGRNYEQVSYYIDPYYEVLSILSARIPKELQNM